MCSLHFKARKFADHVAICNEYANCNVVTSTNTTKSMEIEKYQL